MCYITKKHNKCPICLVENLSWNIQYKKTQMEMFKCGHGTCKQCYQSLLFHNKKKGICFRCPQCREYDKEYRCSFFTRSLQSWTTFSEWYDDYEIYINSSAGNNIINKSVFGKQLIRIYNNK